MAKTDLPENELIEFYDRELLKKEAQIIGEREKHAHELREKEREYVFVIGQKDAIIDQWVKKYAMLLAQKDHIVKTIDTKEAEFKWTIGTLKSDFEDTIALNRLEYDTEISSIKEKMMLLEQSVVSLDLRSRIKAHNDELLVHVQRFRSELLGLTGNLDSRTELLLEDLLMSMMHNAVELRDPRKHVFISDVACQMGYRFTRSKLANVGVPIARRYKQMTGEIPSKHAQFVDGKVNLVNSYMEESIPLIQEELRKAWGI